MKTIFLLVRLLSYPFIYTGKLFKLLYWDFTLYLEEQFYKSPYWEGRILLMSGLFLWSVLLMFAIPFLVAVFAHSWFFLLTSIGTIIVTTCCLVEVHDEASEVEGKAKEIRWGSQPFPKGEVLAMLKDAHTCFSCYWERGSSGRTSHSCALDLSNRPNTCGSWRTK
jgi:hypothetical protein